MKNGSQRSKVRGQKLDRLRTLGVVITGFTLLALAGLNSPHTANPPPSHLPPTTSPPPPPPPHNRDTGWLSRTYRRSIVAPGCRSPGQGPLL